MNLRRRTAGSDVVVVLGGYLLLGLVGAVLWWALVDPPAFTKGPDGSAMGELGLARRFDGDGWFVVLAGVLGISSGMLLTWWRSRDHLLVTVLVAVGAGLAGYVMSSVGRLLGAVGTDPTLTEAAVGERVPVPLVVTTEAAFVVWPIAALAGALLVLWSGPAESGGRSGPAPVDDAREDRRRLSGD